ncbi:hypothetical protein NKI12_14335 [Mesorhizobium australicum]|uniref:Uncharacterized protein n=1 Tax=Mesorhizobium australicum TaxID=536018 RepID=A0ACC6T078_9HYPH
MTLEQALKLLGTSRVIWIDDHFNDTAALLADMLWQNIETTKQCDFLELRDVVAAFEFNAEDALVAMRQILADADQGRRDEIRQEFLKRQQVIDRDPTEELTTDAIERACKLLGVLKADRWSFDGVDARLEELSGAGDEAVSYIIDLKDSAGGKDDTRGLDIVVALHRLGSKGTAFILTHDATEEDEAGTEKRLLDRLEAEVAKAIALCVVSKHRIAGDSETDAVEEALRVAIKRAGLRRSVHEVLVRAREEVAVSFSHAASSLLRIAPEQLDSHVVDQAYREGVSELHVIERALTGFISQQIRKMFGTDDAVLKASERLRDLREIPLVAAGSVAGPELAAFSKAEVWESDSLINAALTPIACGDVFQVDTTEPTAKSAKSRRFVLLGQPCDIALRPGGTRDGTVATFVEVIETDVKSVGKEKEYTLPVTIDGKYQVCDFRSSATVLLSILDLASFRKDGRISYEEGQERPNGLLPGLKSIYSTRTQQYGALIAAGKASAEAIREFKTAQKAAAKAAKEAGQAAQALSKPKALDGMAFQRELMLTFAAPEEFKYVEAGIFEEAVKIKENRVVVLDRPARVTWRMRRVGRIRSPYADALLDRMVGVINRRAFDLDFMKSSAQTPAANEPVPAE